MWCMLRSSASIAGGYYSLVVQLIKSGYISSSVYLLSII